MIVRTLYDLGIFSINLDHISSVHNIPLSTVSEFQLMNTVEVYKPLIHVQDTHTSHLYKSIIAA